MSKHDTLGTIWKVPDELWEEIEPLIAELDPPKRTGRKRADPRKMLNAIIFRMRPGCQWNRLPSSLGDDSTIHRTFQRWESAGLFPSIWAVIQSGCEELDGVEWEWQSAETSMGKARSGGGTQSVGIQRTEGSLEPSAASSYMGVAGRLAWWWLRAQTSTTPSCWRPPLGAWWSSVLCQRSRILSICVWTRRMTIRPDVSRWPDMVMCRTSDGSVRRSWTRQVKSAIRRDDGLWNEHWAGCRSVWVFW